MKYIAILRGINVGGKRKILMGNLKELYERAGFRNVITYIQSGNVIFDDDSNKSELELAEETEQMILEQYGFEVPVIVRSAGDIEKAVNGNPFFKPDIAIERLHLTFLKTLPGSELVSAIQKTDYHPDLFEITGKEVFICCSGRYSDTKLSNTFFEKKLNVTATTRNWKTVVKLVELAKAGG